MNAKPSHPLRTAAARSPSAGADVARNEPTALAACAGFAHAAHAQAARAAGAALYVRARRTASCGWRGGVEPVQVPPPPLPA